MTTTTNGWKQYSLTSDNGTVSTSRYSRFLSLVQLGKDYTIGFAQQPPSDMILSLSLPAINGDNTQQLSASITYRSSNVIIVSKADGTRGTVVSETD